METSSVAIRFLIQQSRLNYLYHIMSRDDNELIKKVFLAQRRRPVKNDWVVTVEKDLEEVWPGMTIDSIGNYKRDQFKKIVKEKIVQSAFDYLRKIQKTHSKVKDIVYSESDIQKYLIDKRFTFEEKSLLVKLRGSMSDIKVNLRSVISRTTLVNVVGAIKRLTIYFSVTSS